jgi:hypothetical protein
VIGVLTVAFGLVVAMSPTANAAKPPPDTIIDSGPAAFTNNTTATFTFHSSTFRPCGAQLAVRLANDVEFLP